MEGIRGIRGIRGGNGDACSLGTQRKRDNLKRQNSYKFLWIYYCSTTSKILNCINRYLYKPVLDALCLTLSDAIRNGSQEKAIELIKQVTVQKLPLSIKLKNPVFVTMDAGLDSIK